MKTKCTVFMFDYTSKSHRIFRKNLNTYIMFSTDLGLIKMAIGYNWANCNLLIAFPDTSSMQCFP